MGAAAAGALFVSAIMGIDAQRKQERAAKRQAKAEEQRQRLEQKRADLRTARERAMAVRRARAARASQLAQATAGGAGTGGSGALGAMGGTQTQLAQGLGFLNQNQQISSQISNLNIAMGHQAAKDAASIGRSQLVSDIAGSVVPFVSKTK